MWDFKATAPRPRLEDVGKREFNTATTVIFDIRKPLLTVVTFSSQHLRSPSHKQSRTNHVGADQIMASYSTAS